MRVVPQGDSESKCVVQHVIFLWVARLSHRCHQQRYRGVTSVVAAVMAALAHAAGRLGFGGPVLSGTHADVRERQMADSTAPTVCATARCWRFCASGQFEHVWRTMYSAALLPPFLRSSVRSPLVTMLCTLDCQLPLPGSVVRILGELAEQEERRGNPNTRHTALLAWLCSSNPSVFYGDPPSQARASSWFKAAASRAAKVAPLCLLHFTFAFLDLTVHCCIR